MARSYRLGKRAEGVAESRERIVRVARELLARPACRDLTVEGVAEAAGVSRATVYNQFESKRGIIQGVFDDIGKRMEFHRVHVALADRDVLLAVSRMITEHCRAWTRDALVIRRVLALATIDAELAKLVGEAEAGRRKAIGALVARLHCAGALRPGISAHEATAVLGTLTSFTTYDELASAGLEGASLARSLRNLASSVVEQRRT